MKLHKSQDDLIHDCLKGTCLDGNGKCIGKTAAELWKESEENDGKSIYQSGLNPDRNAQLHRMEADRLENISDKLSNMSVYSMLQGDHDNSKRLMSQSEEMKRLSTIHRRQANL